MRIICKRGALIGLIVAFLGLVPMTLLAQDTPGDPLAKVEAVIERYEEARQDFITKYRAASKEERATLERPKVDPYLVELVGLADGSPGTEAAAKAWMMVMQLAPQGSDDKLIGVAIETLVRDHASSDATASLGSMIERSARAIGSEPALGYLRQLVEQAPKGATQAGGLLALAKTLNGEDPAEGSAGEKELIAALERVQSDYPELTDSRDRSYAEMAGGMAFERKYLKVGLPVPDITAADLTGVEFSLSDYRGKVVLLDFWGNW
jgi:hypothetical protein